MIDSNFYEGFYDELTEKYNYNQAEGDAEDMNYYRKNEAKKICNSLVEAINYIRRESGFNTNAPISRYEYAYKLFDELENKVSKMGESKYNEVVIRNSRWALFQKFDYMEALRLLEELQI